MVKSERKAIRQEIRRKTRAEYLVCRERMNEGRTKTSGVATKRLDKTHKRYGQMKALRPFDDASLTSLETGLADEGDYEGRLTTKDSKDTKNTG